MKRFVYLVRCSDSAGQVAFEDENDAQELVAKGRHRGPFTVELSPKSQAAEMRELAAQVEVEEPTSDGSLRA